ncbi:MAG: hypothetical protein KDA93_04865 [Planctomycetaceae bacterium]|nr:hypothetical protein [Planctomycetaceae bacterium]
MSLKQMTLISGVILHSMGVLSFASDEIVVESHGRQFQLLQTINDESGQAQWVLKAATDPHQVGQTRILFDRMSIEFDGGKPVGVFTNARIEADKSILKAERIQFDLSVLSKEAPIPIR